MSLSLFADLRHFRMPPPPGVSGELRRFMKELIELQEEGIRLTRLKALKAQLAPPDANGVTHQIYHPMQVHA